MRGAVRVGARQRSRPPYPSPCLVRTRLHSPALPRAPAHPMPRSAPGLRSMAGRWGAAGCRRMRRIRRFFPESTYRARASR